MSTPKLDAYIKEQGWSFYGVVDYDTLKPALEEHEGIFEKWLLKGYHGEMGYLERMKEDRYHLKNKLPDLKSVIVLAAWYSNELRDVSSELRAQEGLKAQSPKLAAGRVARYAAGKDYHKVLKKKLIQLSDWLKQQNPLAETYISVDSGPTADRVLAEAAGLGFFGKNTCLIHPSKGSFFFIASLLTNLDLTSTPKKRMPNCGDCTRCMDACPTGALKGPGQIDAKLCISYLTIENKGGIPEYLRSQVGDRLFGCDICQEVCPFNAGRAHLQSVTMEKLRSDYGVGDSLDLKEVLSIRTDEEYLEMFAGTPLMRTKRRGLLRNACVVAGNSGDTSLIPFLNKIIAQESDEMLKEHAKWAIERLS